MLAMECVALSMRVRGCRRAGELKLRPRTGVLIGRDSRWWLIRRIEALRRVAKKSLWQTGTTRLWPASYAFTVARAGIRICPTSLDLFYRLNRQISSHFPVTSAREGTIPLLLTRLTFYSPSTHRACILASFRRPIRYPIPYSPIPSCPPYM